MHDNQIQFSKALTLHKTHTTLVGDMDTYTNMFMARRSQHVSPTLHLFGTFALHTETLYSIFFFFF